jgi:hypothetical protein
MSARTEMRSPALVWAVALGLLDVGARASDTRLGGGE